MMGKFLILLTLILLPFNSFSQIIIKTKDANGFNVPFVSVYDTLTKVYVISDANGVLELPSNNYTLQFHSLGFIDTTIKLLYNDYSDTLMVYLTEDIKLLHEITVKSNRKPSKNDFVKTERTGDYFSKNNVRVILKEQGKLGYYVPFNKEYNTAFIRSICFKLKQKPKSSLNDFYIEIKLFEIANGEVLQTTLNKKTIIVSFSKLKLLNEIFVTEDILLPPEGIFISIELPKYFSENEKKDIVFMGRTQNKGCNSYQKGLFKPNWDLNTLSKSICQQLPILPGQPDDKYLSFGIGLTFDVYNNKK